MRYVSAWFKSIPENAEVVNLGVYKVESDSIRVPVFFPSSGNSTMPDYPGIEPNTRQPYVAEFDFEGISPKRIAEVPNPNKIFTILIGYYRPFNLSEMLHLKADVFATRQH